jgi:hypothetical protein
MHSLVSVRETVTGDTQWIHHCIRVAESYLCLTVATRHD